VKEGHKLSEYLELANLFPCMVDDEANKTLSKLVSIEELQGVMKEMARDNSLGLEN